MSPVSKHNFVINLTLRYKLFLSESSVETHLTSKICAQEFGKAGIELDLLSLGKPTGLIFIILEMPAPGIPCEPDFMNRPLSIDHDFLTGGLDGSLQFIGSAIVINLLLKFFEFVFNGAKKLICVLNVYFWIHVHCQNRENANRSTRRKPSLVTRWCKALKRHRRKPETTGIQAFSNANI